MTRNIIEHCVLAASLNSQIEAMNSIPISSKLFKVEIAESSVPAIKDWFDSIAEIAAE